MTAPVYSLLSVTLQTCKFGWMAKAIPPCTHFYFSLFTSEKVVALLTRTRRCLKYKCSIAYFTKYVPSCSETKMSSGLGPPGYLCSQWKLGKTVWSAIKVYKNQVHFFSNVFNNLFSNLLPSEKQGVKERQELWTRVRGKQAICALRWNPIPKHILLWRISSSYVLGIGIIILII